MKLEKLMVYDTVSQNTVSVKYGNFQLVEDEIFPFKIIARLEYEDQLKSSTQVSIELMKVTIEKKPLKFPFNIPQKYERQ